MAGMRIPQSVALRVPLKAYLSSDHISAATGKTIAVVISKNGAAFGNPSAGATNATEIASGWYYVDLSTTDTGTAGPLLVRGTAATIDDAETQPYLVVDAHNAGFDGVPSATAAAANGLLTFGAGTGQINPTGGRIPVQSGIQKNVALSNFSFVMKDSTLHAPVTGKTVSVSLAADGSTTFNAATNTPATEQAAGSYKINLTQAEMNADKITFRATASGCDDLIIEIFTDP